MKQLVLFFSFLSLLFNPTLYSQVDTVTEVFSTTELTYQSDVSNSDLLAGITPSTSGWSNSALQLTNGIHGDTYSGAGNTVQGAWTTVGATATYNLGTGANGTGFDLNSIVSIADWESAGYGNQGWKIEVQPVGGTYTTLYTVDYQPLGDEAGTTKVVLTSGSGIVATGIEKIKITANQVNGGAYEGKFVWRELDVFGVSTPANCNSSLTPLTYQSDVSNSDLLTGITPIDIAGWNNTNSASVSQLTDGVHGRDFATAGGTVEGAWTTVGATATYDLGTGDNGTGYDLNSIVSIADWESAGFGNQSWTIEVQPVGGAYTTLQTGDCQPLGVGGGTTKVVVGDGSEILAKGIQKIKITANEVNGGANAGAFVWRELDVFGVSTDVLPPVSCVLNIMPMGDSITAGYTDNPDWNHQFMFGYRADLYTLLVDSGIDVQYMGSSTEPWVSPFPGDPSEGGTYEPPFDLRDISQDNHHGYGGQTASYLNANIASWLATEDPEIILLKIGTNSQDQTGLNTLVNYITTTKPDINIIVAQIMPKISYQSGIVNYNNYIKNTLVPAYQAQGKNVTTIDLYAPFLTDPGDLTSIDTSLFSNGINHPNATGYNLMAHAWQDGINALGLSACLGCTYVDIINDGFESNFGNWNDGGSDCSRSTSNPNTGVYSARLRDNSGVGSSMYTDLLDLSTFSEVIFEFSYYPSSMENGEDFFLEISTNGGTSYSIYQTWASGTDFSNNNRYNESVTISGISFTNNTIIRLRCDASGNNDNIYVDDAVIKACNETCTTGTSCDDGDPCTINDVYDENCDCVGTPGPDSDGDGVCDAIDQCPGFNDALIGTACDDGDDCTSNDIYTTNCNCEGTPEPDADNDGVCDSIDICPSFDDSLIGSSCDDGDVCTTNDVYTSNCLCEGAPEPDNDGDGVCDIIDLCPVFDDTLIGSSCDDGDDCTSNDIYTTNCNCEGTPEPDTDNDGICDPIDICPSFDNSLIGSSCDDGDVCTTNDVYTSNCLCEGTPEPDNDGDGVCDIIDLCPVFDDTLIGSSCDDGDDCTSNDIYTENCNCEGTPEPDTDGDGVCDPIDICPSFDDSLIGSSCDDGDVCTTNDVYTSNCLCEGTLEPDNDGDGYCSSEDPNDNDPCIPDTGAPGCTQCGDIINDGFESGFGNWNDGGNDCARSTSYPNSGTYSIKLRDNSGNSSSMTSDVLDMSSYSQILFDFSYYPVSMENNEDFFLEISTNGGSSYSIYKSWSSGSDFNNHNRYFESVNISGISFTANTIFRLRCDASGNNDQVYIDDLVITDCISQAPKILNNELGKTLNYNQIHLYPNPTSKILFVEYSTLNEVDSSFLLYTVNGQLLRNIPLNPNKLIFEINLIGLTDGLYIIKIINGDGKILKTDRIIYKSK